jgi:hypothetical protein
VENSSASKTLSRPTLPRLQHSQEEQETSTSDAESEPQPQRRGRHKRAPGAPANGGDESEEDSQLGGSGPEADSESENEDAAPSRVQRKPTKPTKQPVRVAASSGGVNSVRQRAVAGAQPLPASSFLSIVHACPNLMGECCCCRRMTWPAHGLVLFEVGRSTVQAALAFDEST